MYIDTYNLQAFFIFVVRFKPTIILQQKDCRVRDGECVFVASDISTVGVFGVCTLFICCQSCSLCEPKSSRCVLFGQHPVLFLGTGVLFVCEPWGLTPYIFVRFYVCLSCQECQDVSSPGRGALCIFVLFCVSLSCQDASSLGINLSRFIVFRQGGGLCVSLNSLTITGQGSGPARVTYFKEFLQRKSL